MIWEKSEDFSAIENDIHDILFEHIFNNILSSISSRISESFTQYVDNIITSSQANYTEFVKCYSYLKQKQREDLVIQHRLVREYLYKVTKIAEQLELQLSNYKPKSYLRIHQFIHNKISLTLNNKASKFTDYQVKLKDLNEKIQKVLIEEEST